jgi:hypothetical protein
MGGKIRAVVYLIALGLGKDKIHRPPVLFDIKPGNIVAVEQSEPPESGQIGVLNPQGLANFRQKPPGFNIETCFFFDIHPFNSC